jgi:hypothetical protein
MIQPENFHREEHNSTYEGPSIAIAKSSYENPGAYRAATAAFRTVDSGSAYVGNLTLVNDEQGSSSSPEALPNRPAPRKPDIIATIPDEPPKPASRKPDIIATIPDEPPKPASRKPDIIATIPDEPSKPASRKPDVIATLPDEPI